jgi:hypothetical protein
MYRNLAIFFKWLDCGYLKSHKTLILTLLIFKISFWLHIASERKAASSPVTGGKEKAVCLSGHCRVGVLM